MNFNQRILPLTPEAISQIRSSKHITSLHGVILSILENSLDAAATRIDVSVDWRRGACTVEDNGCGIPSAEFAENGGLGRMYCTSKRAPEGIAATSTHGSNGAFLAEVGSMSLLSISSKHVQGEHAASLVIHHGNVILRAPSDDTNWSHSGSIVSVQDLFGNMPVRVKQRALAAEMDSDLGRGWQELKQRIAALLLPWPRPCSVRIRDAIVESRSLNISSQHPSVSGLLTEKGLKQLAGQNVKFDLRDALPILFQAGLASPVSKNRWIPLRASTPSVSLKGLICADAAPAKTCQFIALGIHPVIQADSGSVLHEATNKLFSQSSFGSIEVENARHGQSDDEITTRSKDGKGRGNANTHVSLRKAVDRHPRYILQLGFKHTLSTFNSDVEQMNDAALKVLVDILEAAITAWLESNNFKPRKLRRPRRPRLKTEQGHTAVSRSSIPASPTGTGRLVRPPSARRKPIDSLNDSTRCHSAQNPLQRSRKSPDSAQHSAATMPSISDKVIFPNEFSRILTGRTTDRILKTDPSAIEAANSQSEARGISRQYSNVLLELQANTDRLTIGIDNLDSLVAQNIIPANSSGTAGERTEPDSLQFTGLLRDQLTDKVISSDDFGSVDEALLATAETAVSATLSDASLQGEDDTITWTDPITQQVFKINSRTGVVLPVVRSASLKISGSEAGDKTSRERAGIDTSLTSTGKPLTLARRNLIAGKEKQSAKSSDHGPWLPGFLKDWNNPVFTIQDEEPIPVASLTGPRLLEMDESYNCFSHGNIDDRFRTTSTGQEPGVRLSRSNLKHARVLGQVDTKFILCRLPGSDPNNVSPIANAEAEDVLILVDQHAASERVILEELLAVLCTNTSQSEGNGAGANIIRSSNLSQDSSRAKPLLFEIPTQECGLFIRYRHHFEVLGVKYKLSTTPQKSPSSADGVITRTQENSLAITHLPSVVAERCANFPTLCIDMLRTELWKLADGTKRALTSLPNTTDETNADAMPCWMSLLPVLPEKLVSMLHSRACRSAIMFNDPLTLMECEDLVVGKLSKCVFPFVCAHGRVGMVPLGDLGATPKFRSLAGLLRQPSTHLNQADSQRNLDKEHTEDVCTPGELLDWLRERHEQRKP